MLRALLLLCAFLSICAPLGSQQRKLPETPEGIAEAIERGRQWLLARQLLDGSWEGWSGPYSGGITGFVVYTLIKSGLPVDHPAIRRALTYLQHHRPNKTYSAGSLLLALGATGDEQHRKWAQEVADELLSWMTTSGLYGYPGGGVDLSNTLFAVLGLHGAHAIGVKVSNKDWIKMLEGTLDCHSREFRVKLADGRSEYESGFGYKPGSPASGSMASAGITILKLIRDRLGRRVPGRAAKASERATESSLVWLGRNWNLKKNPPNRLWRFYHLYGLERVGSLLELDFIGEHAWYQEGARYLLDSQTESGTWHEGYFGGTGAKERAEYEELNTCMAVLFLRRATARSFTGEDARSYTKVVETQDPEADVVLRATGDTPLTLFVVRSREPGVQARFFAQRGPQAEPILLGESDPEASRLSIQHRFDRPGAWQVWAEVDTGTGVLRSSPLTVRIEMVLDERWLEYASDSERNLLRGVEHESKASSELDAKHPAAAATDGLLAHAWLSKAEDASPQLRLDFPKPIKIRRIVLTPPRTRAGERGKPRPRELVVVLNKRREHAYEMPWSETEKGVLALPRAMTVRSLEIRIASAWDGEPGSAALGFSEIEVQ